MNNLLSSKPFLPWFVLGFVLSFLSNWLVGHFCISLIIGLSLSFLVAIVYKRLMGAAIK
ncbi:MAG: hypothetical protein AAFV95_14125 [Bacteroidota bacterium]